MNFLQKGLAGLESRLDKVLLDESGGQTTSTTTPPPPSTKAEEKAITTTAGGKAGRVSLQERLAAATARKERGRSRSPGIEDAESAEPPKDQEAAESPTRLSIDIKKEETPPRPTTDPPPTLLPTPEIIISPRESLDANGSTVISREDPETTLTLLCGDLALCEARRQEESHAAAERIDALEEKIRYLARESAEESRRKANGAPTGLEKKLAEAQEKIALLLEEGEKLSKNELKLQNSIKKFRAKAQEEEKAIAEAKKRADRAEKEAADAREKAKRAVENEKRASERVKGLGRLESEVEGLRREKETSAKVIAELRGEISDVTNRAEDAESRAQAEALEKERKIAIELKAEMEKVQNEAMLVEEKLRNEVQDLKSKMERDAERARIMEEELKGEQSMMESKMEALRARAEEVSSGASGDAHAKLLRQVETLQTQYAIASENWQGIEGSLLSRIASLEKERDDLTKKEGDLRRKARDLNTKSKTLDMDLEISRSKVSDLEGELTALKPQLDRLKKEHSEEISTLMHTFAKERDTWQKDLQTKLDERAKWTDATRAPSPLPQASLPPPMTAAAIRKFSGPLSTGESYFFGSNNRKNSRSPASIDPPPPEGLGLTTSSPTTSAPPLLPPPSRHGFSTPPIIPTRQDSLPIISSSQNSSRVSLFSGLTMDPDEDLGPSAEYFENIPFTLPSSPYPHSLHHASRHPDMISVSTVAAGPSVQLVERMSSTIRRLESELSAIREESSTVQSQRDDARKEVVEMVREVEDVRFARKRVEELEGEVAELKRREEYTLEMLGEKSELVEELRQDVEDLKGMYRDLVSTVK